MLYGCLSKWPPLRQHGSGALEGPSNPRLQRTPLRAPLSRKPLGAALTSPKGVAMAENKTKATKASVEGFLSAIDDEARRKDCEVLAKLMTKATKQQPKMWGTS